jgi:hypothetical protein
VSVRICVYHRTRDPIPAVDALASPCAIYCLQPRGRIRKNIRFESRKF